MSLNFDSYEEGSKLIFKLDGMLDMFTFKDFEVELKQKLTPHIFSVGISLKSCRNIDSSGMGSIIRLINDFKRRNITLFILDPPTNIRGILKISQIEKYIPISTLEDFLTT